MRANLRFGSGAVALALLGVAGSARGGGFEFPDNGTEALGRGGAFVAKADDPTAMYYNIAGLAQQEGFKLAIDTNLIWHDFAFTSSGFTGGGVSPGTDLTYGGAWSGAGPIPTMHDSDRLFFAPLAAATFDLGRLSRKLHNLVIGLAVFGPSAVGSNSYGVGDPSGAPNKNDPNNTCHTAYGAFPTADNTKGVPYTTCDAPPATVMGADGKPALAPSRYDISQTNLLIVLPTLGISYRPHKMIDVGFGWQMVYSTFDVANANLVGGTDGKSDAYGRVRTSGNSFSSSSSHIGDPNYHFKPGLGSFGWLFSVLLHPTEWMDIGASYRTPIRINTEGTLHPVSTTATLPDAVATFSTTLPMYLRAGARAVMHYGDGTERADLEFDFVWENWSAEHADHVHAEDLTGANFLWQSGTLDADVLHNYKDTYGARLGGAYNVRLRDDMRLTGRLGMFYDSAATDPAYTRLDFNTLEKIGLTVGGGFRMKGVTINVAYAYIFSPSRTVNDSQNYAISAATGSSIPDDKRVYVGNGVYTGYFHILSVGLAFNFS